MIKEFNFLTDYLEISDWWTQRRMTVIDRALLPKTGFVFHKEDEKVCCGWMYKSESKEVCWLAWLTTNPECETMERRRALEKLILHFVEKAQHEGFTTLFAETNNDSLKKRYENTGFLKGDDNSSQFIRRL